MLDEAIQERPPMLDEAEPQWDQTMNPNFLRFQSSVRLIQVVYNETMKKRLKTGKNRQKPGKNWAKPVRFWEPYSVTGPNNIY